MNTHQISNTQLLAEDLKASSPDSSPAEVPAPAMGINLADYQLVEKLGAGGYGEVWKAIGPGGLPKAVKLLYGEKSGQHAVAELKALERMKSLRHPFLLSIERIEVVNSRVIVVTELADRNLSERFEDCRRNGHLGIPRDELLGYLRDAADALDFMFEQHGLQHLDIKPDNLLLQGGHAKVADFGLAKDINTTNVSVLNGFTPMFAAPELFEGRPGRASDQYSLAIVYQMMLTGSSPFNGRTAAQLTAQHLRSHPDLTNLQPIDRPVIARALSKNMNSRFDNCRQFVDELSRRRHGRSSTVLPVGHSEPHPEVPRTALLKTSSQDSAQSIHHQESTPIAIQPLPIPSEGLKPSVMIGAGGLAGTVLRSVKNQIVQRSQGRTCPVPLLQLDTDRDTLTSLRLSADDVGLAPEETLPIPLRSSNEYRSTSRLDLSWLSRRWLFNIPRSGRVEGIRPLGRLALCDHRPAVEARFKQMLMDAVGEQSRGAGSEVAEAGLTADGLDVYVVAATSGGTSSGTVADLGLMVKNVVRQAGLKNVTVHGILLHGTGPVRSVADMQEANTVSVLRELRHLSTPGLGTPRGFEKGGSMTDVAPFDVTSFVHLGDGLNEDGFQACADQVADYLVCAATTGAQADFDNWHCSVNDELAGVAQLRMLGIDTQDTGSLNVASREAGNLSSLLLRRWAGAMVSSNTEKQMVLPAELTDTQTLMQQLGLTEDTLPQQVMKLLRGDTGAEIQSYAAVVTARLGKASGGQLQTYGQVLDLLAQQLSQKAATTESTLHSIIGRVQTKLTGRNNNCRTALDEHLHQLLDSPHRLEGAAAATHYVLVTLKETQQVCAHMLGRIEAAFEELTAQGAMDQQFASDADMRQFCQQYCVLLAYQTIHKCFANHLSTTLTSIASLTERLQKLKSQVEASAADLASRDMMSSSLPQPVIDEFDRFVRTASRDCLATLARSKVTPAEFGACIMKLATRFLIAACNSADGTAVAEEAKAKPFPQSAWPMYRRAGGRRRVLGMVPEDVDTSEWKKTLQNEFGACVATRSVNSDHVSVVCEIEGVPIESVLTRLTINNPQIADVATRIHTRIDLEW